MNTLLALTFTQPKATSIDPPDKLDARDASGPGSQARGIPALGNVVVVPVEGPRGMPTRAANSCNSSNEVSLTRCANTVPWAAQMGMSMRIMSLTR